MLKRNAEQEKKYVSEAVILRGLFTALHENWKENSPNGTWDREPFGRYVM
jgi:hypothetical protein